MNLLFIIVIIIIILIFSINNESFSNHSENDLIPYKLKYYYQIKDNNGDKYIMMSRSQINEIFLGDDMLNNTIIRNYGLELLNHETIKEDIIFAIKMNGELLPMIGFNEYNEAIYTYGSNTDTIKYDNKYINVDILPTSKTNNILSVTDKNTNNNFIDLIDTNENTIAGKYIKLSENINHLNNKLLDKLPIYLVKLVDNDNGFKINKIDFVY
jgi:hypothetical protein